MKVTKIANDKMIIMYVLSGDFFNIKYRNFRKMCIIMNVCQLKYNILINYVKQFIRVMHESGNR